MNATGPAQSEPTETEDAFEMSEEHLDFLPPRLSLGIELGGGALAGELPDGFIFLAMDRAGL